MIDHWGLLLLAIPISALLRAVFGLGKTEYAEPSFGDLARDDLRRHLLHLHGSSAAYAAWIAAGVVAPDCLVGSLVLALLLGWGVGMGCAAYRMRRAVTSGDDSRPAADVAAFPSDAGARLMSSGSAPPLPCWIDIAVLTACAASGIPIGLALRLLC